MLGNLGICDDKTGFVMSQSIGGEGLGSHDSGSCPSYPYRVCILGFGSLNHGLWPLIRVFGTQDLGLQTLRVQT